jgi:hypothetical protein
VTVVIPDPELTLSEAANLEGTLRWFMHKHRPNGDAVLESAADKIVVAARQVAQTHPEEFDAVAGEIEMQRRFGMNE